MNPSSFRSALTQLSVALFIATAAVHPTYSFAEDVPQDAQTNASAGGTVVETALTEAALERESAVPASVWDRIRGGFGIPELNSPLVDRWTTYYAKDPEYVQRMAMRASQYLYNIVEEVESRGLPMELALLPFVESAFQPEALSRAKRPAFGSSCRQQVRIMRLNKTSGAMTETMYWKALVQHSTTLNICTGCLMTGSWRSRPTIGVKEVFGVLLSVLNEATRQQTTHI